MTLGWIDFSPHHRQQIEAALNRLTPRGTLDELGLGYIRDALANHLFPGTSTLHTRSVYLLLVPELLREIAANPKKRTAREVIQLLYKREFEAVGTLVASDPEAWGVIGKSAGKSLKQKPSGAYWSGIRQYGLVDDLGSLFQFVSRCLPHWRAGRSDFGFGALVNRPRPAADWRQTLSVHLQPEEAAFLRTQIKRSQGHSLLAHLLTVLEKEEKTVLEVPAAELRGLAALTDDHRAHLQHCRTYELLGRSCLLTYNEALRQKTNRDPVPLQKAREALYQEVDEHLRPEHVQALTAAFPANGPTNRFLTEWSDLLFQRKDGGNNPEAIKRITQREYNMKGVRARLEDLSRAEALGPDATPGIRFVGGEAQPVFDYRWATVRNHLADLTATIPAR